MSARVQFIGYVQYAPTRFHAEFVVTGDVVFPDGAQVNWDTLKRRGLPIPAFPTYFEWARARFERALQNRRFLNGL